MNRLEDHIESINNKVQQIDLQIHSKLIPTQGIFFEGQVFDAYELTSRIIRSAKKSIVLIDNYIDENTPYAFIQKGKECPDNLTYQKPKQTTQLRLEKSQCTI
jgi:uncharacterized protein (UPF0303 family)